MNKLTVPLCLAIVLAIPAPCEEPPDPAAPLRFFDDYIGSWRHHPDSDFLKKKPEAADDVAFLFEWTAPDRKILRFYEGIRGTEKELAFIDGMVMVDPKDGSLVFLGYYRRRGFLYRGRFEPRDDGFVRDYEVTYPPHVGLQFEEDRKSRTVRYRDLCRRDGEILDCTIERMHDGKWGPWIGGKSFKVVRVSE